MGRDDVAKLCVDTGVLLTTVVFCEEMYQRTVSFASHRVYLTATLGAGSGVSTALLLCLTAAQIVSCATLVTPSLFNRLGTAVPSTALGATVLTEMCFYNGFADTRLCVKSSLLCTSLVIIGLLRGKQRARLHAGGTPLHGAHLGMEAAVRGLCSKCRAGTALPPLCFMMISHAFAFNNYWTKSGAMFERERALFLTTASACSFLLLVAGQDRAESLHLAARLLSWTCAQYKRVYNCRSPYGARKSL